jgi:hypothetical protein
MLEEGLAGGGHALCGGGGRSRGGEGGRSTEEDLHDVAGVGGVSRYGGKGALDAWRRSEVRCVRASRAFFFLIREHARACWHQKRLRRGFIDGTCAIILVCVDLCVCR